MLTRQYTAISQKTIPQISKRLFHAIFSWLLELTWHGNSLSSKF